MKASETMQKRQKMQRMQTQIQHKESMTSKPVVASIAKQKVKQKVKQKAKWNVGAKWSA
jgi:hypothetical protein